MIMTFRHFFSRFLIPYNFAWGRQFWVHKKICQALAGDPLAKMSLNTFNFRMKFMWLRPRKDGNGS